MGRDGAEATVVGNVRRVKVWVENMHWYLRLPSLKSSEIRLDLVVGIVFVFDLVVDAGDFLVIRQSASNAVPSSVGCFDQRDWMYLLKYAYNLAQWFVRPVFDLVPMKRLEVLLRRLCPSRSAPARQLYIICVPD